MELGCSVVGNILNIRPGPFGVASEGAAATSPEKQTLLEINVSKLFNDGTSDREQSFCSL